jgi:hypothetical protein
MSDETDKLHDRLHAIKRVLPSDYTDFGGTVERWADDMRRYPDCSLNCKWALWVEMPNGTKGDWLVCSSPSGPRHGLLTFEHQAGLDCYEDEGAHEGEKGIGQIL